MAASPSAMLAFHQPVSHGRLRETIGGPPFRLGASASNIDLHDARHAGHDMDIADGEAGRDRDGVVDQRGAARQGRHALAGRVEVAGRGAAGIVAAIRARVSACGSHGTPKAAATHSLVMSSCVGPMPPVVKTWS